MKKKSKGNEKAKIYDWTADVSKIEKDRTSREEKNGRPKPVSTKGQEKQASAQYSTRKEGRVTRPRSKGNLPGAADQTLSAQSGGGRVGDAQGNKRSEGESKKQGQTA